MSRKVVLYIAMSLDGFIAKPDNDLSWLNIVEKEGEDYGYSNFCNTTDTIIIGRKTYDKVVSMGFENPHPDKTTYIVTKTPRPQNGNLIYYSDDIIHLVNKLKSESGKNIYCDGGAEIVNLLLNNHLLDEMIISVIPILLGEGIKLFNNSLNENKLTFQHTKAFESGLVQLHYALKA